MGRFQGAAYFITHSWEFLKRREGIGMRNGEDEKAIHQEESTV